MKTLMAVVVLLAALSVQAEDDDMQKYLRDTQTLVDQGFYQGALDRFLWFHDHALEHAPAMSGVRLSFALSLWKDLGNLYPPALAAMKKVRDDKTTLLEAGKGRRDLFADVMALNRTLGEEGKTVDLFRKLDQTQADLATACWDYAADSVIKAKGYDLAKKYRWSPIQAFDRAREYYSLLMLRNVPKSATQTVGGVNVVEPEVQTHIDSLKAHAETWFVEESLRLMDVAVAMDDPKAAREIQAKALAVLDDPRLRDAVPQEKKPDAPPQGK